MMIEKKRSEVHDEVFQLLPWYSNGTLGALEVARVDEHLADCDLCREELVRCREVGEAVAEEGGLDWEPGERSRQRVFQRIEEGALAERSRSEASGELGWWESLTQPVRWALAAQAIAIAALGALLLLPRPDASYQTLTTIPSGGVAEGSRLQIVFEQDTAEVEIRSMLLGVDGSIVSGPSERGVYELALPAEAALEQVLVTLRANPRVRLAEPLRSGAAR